MRSAASLLCLLIAHGLLYSQDTRVSVVPSLLSGRGDALFEPRPYVASPETVKVLAVMVQFQVDDDPRSTGNGQFDLSTPSDSIIDAPPRNTRYFEDHLTFVQNYYRKVSRGKTVIRSTVVDSVFTLPAVMATYSPPRTGPPVAVGNLARDSWQMVDASGLVPSFAAYDCFIVFHAGVGRDIDLVAILGYDPTPFDIPSLYIGSNSFKSFYGDDFPGIVVNGGQDTITNSIIIPETQTRSLPGVGGEVRLELGINGLLCASMGNFLGLPDLFDTRTGRTAIGRFGLMDGQAIFSFAGVFPPEPSAWEKYWLGWVQPVLLRAGVDSLVLPAVGLDTASANVIYKAPISAREYFLIENRNRDPHRNGQTVTSTFNGVTRQQTFARDTTNFNAFNISALAGTVTDVEDYDWSLPGGVDSRTTEFFDGGVLIWHIDETVIRNTIASNTVNADPRRRGVDVEEADGSQDLGQEYGFISPGAGSEEGTPLDFWYQGNSAPVYRNVFSPTSFPNSLGNNYASSHITIRDFSSRGPLMRARAIIGTENVKPLDGFPRETGDLLPAYALTTGQIGSKPTVVVATSGMAVPRYTTQGVITQEQGAAKVFAWTTDASSVLPGGDSTGVVATSGLLAGGFVTAPAIRDLDADDIPELALGFGTAPQLIAFSARDADSTGLFVQSFATPASARITTAPLVGDSIVVLGTARGWIFMYGFDGSVVDSLRVLEDTTADVAGVSGFNAPSRYVVTGNDGSVAVVAYSAGSWSIESRRNLGSPIAGPAVSGIFGRSAAWRTVVATTDGLLHMVDQNLVAVPGFPVNTGGTIAHPPALADLDGDGLRDVVVLSGFRIHAYNHSGASLDFFPITVRSSLPLSSYPIVADVDGDGLPEVVAVSRDGLVVAHDRAGRMAPGFPLQAGTGIQSIAVVDVPLAASSHVGIGLAVASSEDGSVSAWQTGAQRIFQPLNRPWPQYQRDALHSGVDVTPLTGTPLSADFFPASRAYNWPNPVYDGRTYLRYFVREDAAVRIRVFDLAGDLVTEFSGPGVGGVDNEVVWDLADVQSGIYFARIEANGSTGNGVAVVKVAVVK